MENNQNELKNNVLISIRAYNEEKTIYNLIKEIVSLGYKNIALIDDCSTDKTPKIAQKLKEELKNKNINFYYIRHLKNLNMGGGLLTSLKLSKLLNKHLITMDGDYQHQPNDIKNFLKEIENYDVLLGNRYLTKNQNIPKTRKILHFLNRIFNFILSKKIVNDIHNGFRAYNKEVLNLFEKELIYFDGSYADNVYYIIAKHNLKIKEIPTNIIYTKETLKKGQKVEKVFIKLLIKSFLLRFFNIKKRIFLCVFISFLLNLFIFIPIFLFLKEIGYFLIIPFILNFFVIFSLVFILLEIWIKKIKQEKDFKNFISEKSLENIK